MDREFHNFKGHGWLYKYGNELYSTILMCMPSLESEKTALNGHLSILLPMNFPMLCMAQLLRKRKDYFTLFFS